MLVVASSTWTLPPRSAYARKLARAGYAGTIGSSGGSGKSLRRIMKLPRAIGRTSDEPIRGEQPTYHVVTEAGPFRRFGRSPVVRVLFVGALIAVSTWRIIGYLDFIDPPFRTDSDLSADYVSAKEWRAGRDSYAPLHDLNVRYFGEEDANRIGYESTQRNPHPPALILLHAPFSALSIHAARIVHLSLMLTALFLAVFLFCRKLAVKAPTAALIALVSLSLPIVRLDARWAQINGLVLLGLVLAWMSLRSDREGIAGIILGGITAIKIFPVLLIIPLVRMRRRKAAVWMAASGAAFTLLGGVTFGMDATVKLATEISRDNFETWGSAPHSISLVTLPFRFLASDRWRNPAADVSTVVLGLGLCAVLFCVAGAWKTSASASHDVFWASVPWMILGSPLGWAHHLVLMIPLAVLIIHRWRSYPSRLDLYAVPFAILFAILATGTMMVEALAWVFRFPIENYENIVAAMTLVVVALVLVALTDFVKRSAPETTGPEAGLGA